MNKLKKVMIMLIVFTVCVTAIPSQVQAASSKNKKAHKAYQKQLKKDKKEHCYGNGKLTYAYKDLNGDGIDELIVDTMFPSRIYTYRNGKVKEIYEGVWESCDIRYYTRKKVLYEYIVGTYGEEICKSYYKYEKGKYKLKCNEVKWGRKTTYYINGKKKSAKSYKAYVKKLTRGEKAKRIGKLKWKEY